MTAPAGGDVNVRILVTREGAQALQATRTELTQLGQSQQAFADGLVVEKSAVLDFGNTTRAAGEHARTGAGHIGHLRSAITLLALEATNTQGPLGRLASALLLFGGGSALVIGIAAGIAAIAGAYRLAGAEAEHLRDQNDKLNQSWRELRAQGHPTVKLMNDLVDAVGKQSEAQEELQRLTRTFQTPHGEQTRGTPGEIAQARVTLDAARRVVDELRNEVRRGQQGLQFQDQLRQLRAQQSQIETALAEAGTTGQVQGPLRRQLLAIREQIRDVLREAIKIDPSLAADANTAGQQVGQSFADAFRARVHLDTLLSELGRELTNPSGVLARFGLPPARAIGIGSAIPSLGGPRSTPLGPFTGLQGLAPLSGTLGNVQAAQKQAELNFLEAQHNQLLEFSRNLLTQLRTPQEQYNDSVRMLQQAVQAGIFPAEKFDEAIKKLKKDMDDAANSASGRLGPAIITAVAGVIAAIAGHGGAGGLLSGIGGIIGLLPGGQLAGAAIAGLGAIVSSSQSSQGVRINGYSAEAIAQLRAMQTGTAEHVTIVLVDPRTGAETAYEARRRTRRDANPRIPVNE